MVRWEELNLDSNSGAHGGGDAVLRQHPAGSGIAGRLRFRNAYGCRFEDLRLVAMWHSV